MHILSKSVLTLPLLFSVPAAMSMGAKPLDGGERTALQSRACDFELRAGTTTPRVALNLDERASLRQAEQRSSSDLANLRAGLTDREIMWIVLGVLVVLLIIIIA